MGAGGIWWVVPSTDPGESPETSVASVAPGPDGAVTRPEVRGPTPERPAGEPPANPRQSAIEPREVPDPLGREYVPSRPPADPDDWDAIHAEQARVIAEKQHVEAVAFLEEVGVTGGQASQVLRAVRELSETVARVRVGIQTGTMTPAEGREAFRAAREQALGATEAALGPEQAEALGQRLQGVGGGF